MILPFVADAAAAIRYEDLGLSPIALDMGFFKLRWYSIAYIAGIIVGWWYLTRLIAQPGSPMARRHADDFVFYATLGIILGGRLGYVVFYKQDLILNPVDILKLWEGGMSLHGGVIGVVIAITWFTRKHGLNWLRVHDYVACCWPFGQFFGRLANFANGELWGHPTTLPWGVIFPGTGDEIARHPSQIYQGLTEGLLLCLILMWLFWKTDARHYPGRLVGTAILGYGGMRFFTEFFREPDPGVYGLFGLSMGQTLCVPMVLLGAYLVATSRGRRKQIDAGAASAGAA